MSELDSRSENPRKRKKKRSAMQMAKKCARRRNYGGEVDDEFYQYMLQILQGMRQEFPTLEEKQIFVNNVYEQTIGKEVEFAKNQVGSRILDGLIKFANFHTIERFSSALFTSLRPLCSDRFASHVLQKLIGVCADRGNTTNIGKAETLENPVSVKESEIPKYNDIALKLSKYVINNMEEFIWDTYANHVFRTVLESLGGFIGNTDEWNKKKASLSDYPRTNVTDQYKQTLIDACIRISKWPRFLEFGRDELSSGFLQSVLYSLKDIESELTATIVNKIIKECFKANEEEKLSDIFITESSIRLLEACLGVCGPKEYADIEKRLFENRLKELSLMKGVNFCVQRLFEYCPTKELLEKFYDELSPDLTSILKIGHTGILLSLAQACSKLNAKQAPFIITISKILHCDEPVDRQINLVPLVATLKNFEEFNTAKEQKKKVPIHLHGSLIVQAMLRFNKPIKVINSLLSMNSDELTELFEDPRGSRIMDAFMEAPFVGEKSREKLAKNLRGNWAQLARGTHGSRCLEKIWQWAKGTQQNIIMEELAQVGEGLRSTKCGALIHEKFKVALFSRNKKEWQEAQGKSEKAKMLLADIIGGASKKLGSK